MVSVSESQQNIILLMIKNTEGAPLRGNGSFIFLRIRVAFPSTSLEYYIVSEIFKDITNISYSSWEGKNVPEYIFFQLVGTVLPF